MADPAHLDAGPVVLQRILQAPLHRAVVAVLLHVDEVDDHKAGKIAQPQLPGDFVAGFEVGLERRVFDIVFARRLARVDVDRNQRFRLVHHHVAAGRQRNGRRVERVELRFRLVLGKQRARVLVELHVLGMRSA